MRKVFIVLGCLFSCLSCAGSGSQLHGEPEISVSPSWVQTVQGHQQFSMVSSFAMEPTVRAELGTDVVIWSGEVEYVWVGLSVKVFPLQEFMIYTECADGFCLGCLASETFEFCLDGIPVMLGSDTAREELLLEPSVDSLEEVD